MRSKIKIFLTMCLVLVLLSGCALFGDNSNEKNNSETENVSGEAEKEYPYDYTSPTIFAQEDWFNNIPFAEVLGVQENGDYFQQSAIKRCGVMQGATSDGKYTYIALNDGLEEGDTCVVKVDMKDWTIALQSEPLKLGHANGMTINTKENKLYVSHAEEGVYKKISVLDPENLTIIGEVTLGYDIGALAYNEKRDVYVVRYAKSDDFGIVDTNFKEVERFVGDDSGLGYQNIGCDDDYIYVLDSGVIAQPGVEIFKIYDWEGKFLATFRLNAFAESEAIFVGGDKIYVGFYTGGARIFEMKFDEALLEYSK